MLDWLDDNGYDSAEVWKGISGICVKTCLAVAPMLSHAYNTCFRGPNYGASCFEILGFDIMLDNKALLVTLHEADPSSPHPSTHPNGKAQPWLIEVNHTPSFSCDTPFDEAIPRGPHPKLPESGVRHPPEPTRWLSRRRSRPACSPRLPR